MLTLRTYVYETVFSKANFPQEEGHCFAFLQVFARPDLTVWTLLPASTVRVAGRWFWLVCEGVTSHRCAVGRGRTTLVAFADNRGYSPWILH